MDFSWIGDIKNRRADYSGPLSVIFESRSVNVGVVAVPF